MFGVRLAAALLIIAGTIGLIYGRLTFTKSEQSASLGPIGFTIKERQSVAIPTWLGAGAIAAGALLLLARRRS
jgi:LPXTG-motif cell wall-anchored protein